MVYQRARQLFKYTLLLARFKLLYTRITLTRFTTIYFFLSLFACLGFVSLQGLTLSANTQALKALETVFAESQRLDGLPIVTDGVLRMCSDIPDNLANCTVMASFGGTVPLGLRKRELVATDFLSLPLVGEFKTTKSTLVLDGLTDGCVASLHWLDDVFDDAQREDVVSFFFRIWLFMLSAVAVLNESIPHLLAACVGQVLGMAWAAYRLRSMVMVRDRYREYIVGGVCRGVDVMGDWWDQSIAHSIPIVVLSVLVFVGSGYMSYKLFKIYTNQSFCRVGASDKIYRIYKIVLLFSVCIQLSVFFSIASAAMWIDKVSHGQLSTMAAHAKIYLAIFITELLLHIPWFYIGWACVRKECSWRFSIFAFISAFFIIASTVVFASRIYRHIFSTWAFFATITVTSYCLMVTSVVLAIICQFNFGQGLKQYLLVTEALEGVDFTPVSFTTNEKSSSEKEYPQRNGYVDFDSPILLTGAWQPAEQIISSNTENRRGDQILPTYSAFARIGLTSSNRTSAYLPKTSHQSLAPSGARSAALQDQYVSAYSRRAQHVNKTLPVPAENADDILGRMRDVSPVLESPAMSSPRMKRLLTGPGLPSSPRARIIRNQF